MEYILDTKVDFDLNYKKVLSLVEKRLLDKTTPPAYICTINPEFVIDALHDKEFQNILNKSFLSVPDGSGVLYAKKFIDYCKSCKKNILGKLSLFIYGLTFPFKGSTLAYISTHKVLGSQLLYDLCNLASDRGFTVAFLGGWVRDKKGNLVKEDLQVAEKTSHILKNIYPNLKIIDATSAFSWKHVDDDAYLDYIHKIMQESGVNYIDMLFVSFGHVKQEKWIFRNINRIPVRLAIGLGGSFDYVMKLQNKPPEFMLRMNLEWLYRLVKEPWRFRRILKAFPIFPYKILCKTLSLFD